MPGLEDLLKNSGNNEPFLAKIYACQKSDIVTLPPMTTSPTTNAQKVTRTGTHTMVSGKVYNVIEIIPAKAEPKINVAGDEQMMSTSCEATFEVSGKSAAMMGWVDQHKNKEMIFILVDRNGHQEIWGDDVQGAYFTKIEINGGKDRAGKFTIKYQGAMPTVWAGTVPLT